MTVWRDKSAATARNGPPDPHRATSPDGPAAIPTANTATLTSKNANPRRAHTRPGRPSAARPADRRPLLAKINTLSHYEIHRPIVILLTKEEAPPLNVIKGDVRHMRWVGGRTPVR
ncbi:hypothetical protein Arub01_53320 [Actinomadura rubrobrunea]|uniref:Uncharacterized protein n=1 Tax=Actinomadura rubrobrunea TaxID=115335 RepID=A0A9W6Q1W4_9ACTN|nr:hypothetical protein Arub01_53320 [Actinomadura rubrobrunea]